MPYGRDDDWRDDEERERWERDREPVFRGDERPGEAYYAGGHYVDTPRRERHRDDAPRSRRFGRYYGSTGDWTGVGSAAGYSGFGGPGWTSGGYGDPGYQTSGFGSSDYGSSRIGAGSSGNLTNEDYRRPFSSRDRLGRASEDYRPVGESHERGYGQSWEREDRTPRGPHFGKGPKGYQRTDERIREEVSERLMEHDAIDASDVEVEVKEGEVTLSGTVDSRDVKWMAEGVAESVGGVKDVHNRLRVSRR